MHRKQPVKPFARADVRATRPLVSSRRVRGICALPTAAALAALLLACGKPVEAIKADPSASHPKIETPSVTPAIAPEIEPTPPMEPMSPTATSEISPKERNRVIACLPKIPARLAVCGPPLPTP